VISEEELERFRQEGVLLRVIRDIDPANDIKGIVVAWDDREVLIRKRNRRLVKLSRGYIYQPFSDARPETSELLERL